MEMCKGCQGDVQRLPGRCASAGKQSQLLLQPTEVDLVCKLEWSFIILDFHNNKIKEIIPAKNQCKSSVKEE